MMGPIKGKAVDPAQFSPFHPAKVLFDLDGPRSFTFIPADRELYWAHWFDESKSGVRYLVVPFSPAIFAGGVLNQNYSGNGPSSGAVPGSVIQIFATGLSGAGSITAHIHDRDIAVPYYAGPAPGLPGVQQVNLVIPEDLAAMTTEVYVCATGATKTCSTPVPLTIAK